MGVFFPFSLSDEQGAVWWEMEAEERGKDDSAAAVETTSGHEGDGKG